MKHYTAEGVVLFDVEEIEHEAIWQHVVSKLVAANDLPKEDSNELVDLLLRTHK